MFTVLLQLQTPRFEHRKKKEREREKNSVCTFVNDITTKLIDRTKSGEHGTDEKIKLWTVRRLYNNFARTHYFRFHWIFVVSRAGCADPVYTLFSMNVNSDSVNKCIAHTHSPPPPPLLRMPFKRTCSRRLTLAFALCNNTIRYDNSKFNKSNCIIVDVVCGETEIRRRMNQVECKKKNE